MDGLNFLGVAFDDLDVKPAVRSLLARPQSLRFTYIVTPNADHLARLKRQPKLRLVYDAAWMRLLDSRLLQNAARGLGLRAPRVATGADICSALLSALPAQTVALIGLDPRHLPALAARYPHLTFAHHWPPRDLLHDRAAFAAARDFAVETGAAFTFIALGSPLQELLAYAIALQPGSQGVGLCIGAALEFLSGAQNRAPAWMRRAGLEWLHRLARSPKRLARRYLLDDPPVLLDLLAERFRRTGRRSGPDQPPPAPVVAISGRGPCLPPPRARLHEIRDGG